MKFAILLLISFSIFSCDQYIDEMYKRGISSQTGELSNQEIVNNTPLKKLYVMAGQSNVGYYTHTAMDSEYATGVKGWDETAKQFVDSLSWLQIQQLKRGVNVYKHSPLINIAKKLRETNTTDSLYFLAEYVPGTNLYDDWSVIRNGQRRGSCLDELIEEMDSATNQVQFDEIHFIWVQGESDCGNLTYASTYQVNEDTLFTTLKNRYNITSFINYKINSVAAYKDSVFNAKYFNESNRTDTKVIEIPVVMSGEFRTYNNDNVHMSKYGVRLFADSVYNYIIQQ